MRSAKCHWWHRPDQDQGRLPHYACRCHDMGVDMECDLATDAAKAEHELHNVLWNYIPQNSREFSHIPEVNRNMVENEAMIDNYLLGKTIGRGKHTIVRKCSHTRNGVTNLAIKVIVKESIKSLSGVKRVENELRALKHVSMQATAKNVTYFVDSLHSERYLYIVMERLQFDLFMDCYQENVDMNVTAVILSGVASALQHLHSVNIAHNDLKPENILLNMSPHDLTVKLCDLGNAWIGKPGELRIRDHVGTGGFMAPECIMEEKYCPFAADIFSFGCVALEMIMAEDLFPSVWMACYSSYLMETPGPFGESITKAICIAQRQIKIYFDSERCENLTKCLEFEPCNRPSLDMLRELLVLKECDVTAALKMLVSGAAPEESQPPSPKSPVALLCSEDLVVDLCEDECSASSVTILEQLQRSAPRPPSRTRRPAILNKTLPPCSKPSAAVPQHLLSQTMPHSRTKPKRHSTPSSSYNNLSPVTTPRSVTFISSTASSQQKQLRRKTEGTGYMSPIPKLRVLY